MIVGSSSTSSPLIASAYERMKQAYRPSTTSAHRTHIRSYFAFLHIMQLPSTTSLHNILVFIEYLHQNSLSYKVISSYVASIKSMAILYNIPSENFSHPAVARLLRSLSLTSHFAPTPRGLFDIPTLYNISLSCDSTNDPHLYRAIFLVAFYGFLRMSNIAPHSFKNFNKCQHFLRQDVIFGPPGVHLILKWTKTMQDRKSHHVIQLPTISNKYLCPVQALRALLRSRTLSPQHPLFASISPPHRPIIDTHIRDVLKNILISRNISPSSHGFHTFRRSGATFAFDHSVPLQNIMSHGLWKSSAVWTYLQNASVAPSLVPSTFSAFIPSSF